MNQHQHMHQQQGPMAAIASEATREAIEARHEFERAAQRRKVRLLTQQVSDRLGELASRIYEVQSRLPRTEDTFEFAYPAGAFLRDTETLDHLLATLSTEVESLANMEAAKEASDSLTAKFDALIEQAKVEGDQQPPEARVFEMPGAGQYL